MKAAQKEKRDAKASYTTSLAIREFGAEVGGRVNSSPYVTHRATIGKGRTVIPFVHMDNRIVSALRDNSLAISHIGSRKVHGKGTEFYVNTIKIEEHDGEQKAIRYTVPIEDVSKFDDAKAKAIELGLISSGRANIAKGAAQVCHSDGDNIFTLSNMEMMCNTVTIVSLDEEMIAKYGFGLRVYGMGQSILIPIPNDEAETIAKAFSEATSFLAHIGRCGTSIRNKGEQFAHWHLDSNGNLVYAGSDDKNKICSVGATADAEQVIEQAWTAKMQAVDDARASREAKKVDRPAAKDGEWEKVKGPVTFKAEAAVEKPEPKTTANQFSALAGDDTESETSSEDEVDGETIVTPEVTQVKVVESTKLSKSARRRRNRKVAASKTAASVEEPTTVVPAEKPVDEAVETPEQTIARLQAELAAAKKAVVVEPSGKVEEDQQVDQPEEFPSLAVGATMKKAKTIGGWSKIAATLPKPKQVQPTEEDMYDSAESDEEEVEDLLQKITAAKSARQVTEAQRISHEANLAAKKAMPEEVKKAKAHVNATEARQKAKKNAKDGKQAEKKKAKKKAKEAAAKKGNGH